MRKISRDFRERRFGGRQLLAVATLLAMGAIVTVPKGAIADEGGVSFWLPGFFGSLAATPQQPGWSFASIYYHTDVSAIGNAALS
jgi:hypothetical protein